MRQLRARLQRRRRASTSRRASSVAGDGTRLARSSESARSSDGWRVPTLPMAPTPADGAAAHAVLSGGYEVVVPLAGAGRRRARSARGCATELAGAREAARRRCAARLGNEKLRRARQAGGRRGGAREGGRVGARREQLRATRCDACAAADRRSLAARRAARRPGMPPGGPDGHDAAARGEGHARHEARRTCAAEAMLVPVRRSRERTRRSGATDLADCSSSRRATADRRRSSWNRDAHRRDAARRLRAEHDVHGHACSRASPTCAATSTRAGATLVFSTGADDRAAAASAGRVFDWVGRSGRRRAPSSRPSRFPTARRYVAAADSSGAYALTPHAAGPVPACARSSTRTQRAARPRETVRHGHRDAGGLARGARCSPLVRDTFGRRHRERRRRATA